MYAIILIEKRKEMMSMNTLTIANQLNEYYQQEYRYTKVALVGETNPIERGKICWYCLQRCLGACQYAQMLGLRFETAEGLFEAQRELLKILEAGA
jgi:hypothetical protein